MKGSLLSMLLLSCCFIACSFAQQSPAGDQTPSIDAGVRAAVIGRVAQLMTDNYVDPQKGEQLAQKLQKQLKAKAYKGLDDPRAFAAKLLEDMQQELHDVHLNFSYRPQASAGSAYDDRNEDIIIDGPADGEEEGDAVIIIEEGPGSDEPDFENIPPAMLAMMQSRNFGLTKAEILTGNIGYFRIDDFMAAGPGAAGQVAAVMQLLQHSEALIIDVRNNPGGGPFMIQQICSYFFEKPTHLNSLYHRPSNRTQDFWTHEVKGSKLTDKPIYVLASAFTGSAAEEFCYDLQTRKRATIVGETTVGGGHIVAGYDAGHGFELSVPNGKAINPITQSNWEGTGVAPDIEAPAAKALAVAHAQALRHLMEQAKDPMQKQQMKWAVERLEAESRHVELDATKLQQYAGTYGPRVVTLVEGELHIQRAPGPRMGLVPITENKFMYADLDPFRLEFVWEKDRVSALKLTYPDGREELFKKE